jgi:hypothetical protein
MISLRLRQVHATWKSHLDRLLVPLLPKRHITVDKSGTASPSFGGGERGNEPRNKNRVRYETCGAGIPCRESVAFNLARHPDDVFEALATDYKNELSLIPSPGDDPAMADHKASITASEVARVMDFVRTLRRLARSET